MPEPSHEAPDLDRGPAPHGGLPDPVRREDRVEGRRVVWHEAGRPDGPTLLLLHGGGADAALMSWSLVLRAFPDRRLVAPDLPGYGETPRFRGPYTVEALAAWTEGFAEAARLAPGSVMGISMGGATAIAYALRAPHRVRALVPVAAFGLGGPAPLPRTLYLLSRLPLTLLVYGAVALNDRAARRALRNVFADLDRVPPDLLDAVRAAARVQLRTGSFLAFMRGETHWRGFRTDLSERLPALAVPTLFVHGTQDALVPLAASERAARLVPGARLARIEGAGHLPMREHPEAFERAVRPFLDAAHPVRRD